MQIKMSLCAAMKWQKVTILVSALALISVLSMNTFAQEETRSESLEDESSQQINDETSEENAVENTAESQEELQENVNLDTPVSNADSEENAGDQDTVINQESTDQDAPARIAPTPRARPPSGQVANLSSTIVGNQEQPQVLYIVPWKPVADSDLENQNIQSQLDIIFGHVERVELRRELLYMEQFANADEEVESN